MKTKKTVTAFVRQLHHRESVYFLGDYVRKIRRALGVTVTVERVRRILIADNAIIVGRAVW